MKKVLIGIITVMALALMTGCNGNTETKAPETTETETPKTGEKTIIKIGHVEPEDRSTHRALAEFKKAVEERTNNQIVVELYPNGALGGDVQLTESVAMGTLDAALPTTSVLTAYSDDFGVLDMPYLFTSSEAAFNALDGDVGEYLNEKLTEQGITSLGYSYNGPRSTTTNTVAIEKPEDLKGLKMRVMESPIFIDFYNTLGANATPMGYTELYTGLQQGTVEAQENPPSLIYANKFYEVQKYLSVDEHVHNFLAFIFNTAKFEKFTAEQQEILKEESKNYVKLQREMELKDNQEAIDKLATEGGLKVNVLTEEQKKVFFNQLKPMYDKYESKFGKELFDLCEKYN